MNKKSRFWTALKSGLAIGLSAMAFSGAFWSVSAFAALTITFQEDGTDVVATAVGTVNTDGLSASDCKVTGAPCLTSRGGTNGRVSVIDDTLGYATEVTVGVWDLTARPYGYVVTDWNNSNTATFITRNGESVGVLDDSNGTGDWAGITTGVRGEFVKLIWVPENYVSKTPLDARSVWPNTTLAALELIEGTYTYTFGTAGNEDSITLIIGSAAATVPDAPTIGTATAGVTQASVAFTAPTSDGGAAITGYTATSSPGGLTGTCASSPCTVTGLTGGVAYTFTVVATNAVGNSAASAASNSVTPTAATVPDAPTIGTATAGDSQASVTFTAPTSDGGAAITGYTATSSPGGLTGVCSASPCTVTGLTNGVAYTFTVVATNSVGNSAASAASNSVTPSAPIVTYTIGGSVTGLGAGESVTLQNNGGDDLVVSANDSFVFGTSVASGGAYAVTAVSPTANGQVCTVTNGSGNATANVTNVTVGCVDQSVSETFSDAVLTGTTNPTPGASTTVTVTVRDIDNLLVSGLPVTLTVQSASVDASAVTIQTSPTITANGEATFTVSSTVAQQVIFAATFNPTLLIEVTWATLAPAEPVPTLSAYMLMLLVLATLIIGARRYRRI